MSSPGGAEIDRILGKIRVLEQILERGEIILIAEGDPDYPQGLKFTMPKTWLKQIRTTIKALKKELKARVDLYATQG